MPKQINSFSGKNDKGFTLVEILVSLVILLILVVAFVPLFTFVTQAFATNKAKDIAIELATQKMEELRSLPYTVYDSDYKIDTTKPQLGIIGGNPPGSVKPTETVKINGKDYEINTSITWDESESSKIVSVTVTAPGVFDKGVNITNRFDTKAAQEGMRVKPGSILVQIYNGKGELLNEAVSVSIETSDHDDLIPSQDTIGGEALFDNLPGGTYSVSVLVPSNMAYHPELHSKYDTNTQMLVEDGISVTYNKQAKVEFIMDTPAKVSFVLKDQFSRTIKSNVIDSTLNLYWYESDPANASDINISFNQNDITNEGKLSTARIGNLWPGGTYSLQLTINKNLNSNDLIPYGAYDMATDIIKPRVGGINGTEWDGTLSAGNNADIYISLEPLLKVHLISSKGVETRKDGKTDYITKWTDQSGYGNHATNSNNNSTQPTLSSSEVVFDMNNEQKLTMPDSVICTNDFVVFAVANSTIPSGWVQNGDHEVDNSSNSSTDGTSGQKYLFWPDHGGDHAAGMGISLGRNGMSNYEHGSGYMPPTVVYGSKAGTNILGTGFNTLAIKYKNSENEKPSIYVNGNDPGNLFAGIYMQSRYASARSTVYSPTIIGGGVWESGKTRNNQHFNGKVKEILIYKSVLLETNIQQINNYLNANH